MSAAAAARPAGAGLLDRRRGFLGSWLEFGTFTGYLMGALVVTVADATLSDDQLLAWGWRIPFFVALLLGVVGVYLRTRLADTPAYAALERRRRSGRSPTRPGRRPRSSRGCGPSCWSAWAW